MPAGLAEGSAAFEAALAAATVAFSPFAPARNSSSARGQAASPSGMPSPARAPAPGRAPPKVAARQRAVPRARARRDEDWDESSLSIAHDADGGSAATPTARPSITQTAVAAASAFDGKHSPSPAGRAGLATAGGVSSRSLQAPAAGPGMADDDASLVPIAAAEAGVAAACGSQLLGLSQTLDMLTTLGGVLWWQAQHRGDRVQLALSELETPSLRASAWAHGQAGLAYFESGHYNKVRLAAAGWRDARAASRPGTAGA